MTVHSLYPAGVPSGAFVEDATSYTLGTGIKLLEDGTITGVRFYYGHEEGYAWPVKAHIFNAANGNVVASGESQGPRPEADGWVVVPMEVPYTAVAEEVIVAAYLKEGGIGYMHQANYWPTIVPSVPGVMEAPTTPGILGGAQNGLFHATESDTVMPDTDFNNGNFFVDITFDDGIAPAFEDARLGWGTTPGGYMINKGAL